MKIDFLSDLHGHYPETPGGDVLVLCGDYTAADKMTQWGNFFDWLKKQDYCKKIIIGGNHDGWLYKSYPKTKEEAEDLKEVQDILNDEDREGLDDFIYLCDSGVEIQGVSFWGTPWTKTFPGINPACKYFMFDMDIQMKERFDLVPEGTDILITHGPPYGILDKNEDGISCGSIPLLDTLDRVKPLYMVFGHIHEEGGKEILYKHIGPNTWCLNVSYVDERYRAKNKVKRIYIPNRSRLQIDTD